MHRAFRSPLIPALQSVARARLYSSATTTQPGATTGTGADSKLDNHAHHKVQLNRTINADTQMREELKAIRNRLKGRPTLKDIQNLVSVHEMMRVYRKFRDEHGQVNASEPIHAILTTLRLRSKVLKPIISTIRRQIMGSQNVVLNQYLNEIADDLLAGRSYASHFALCYMLTAFSTMDNDAQASAIWKRFINECKKEDMAEKLTDPRVVSAALRSSDPSVLNLDEIERIHSDTTKKHGRYMLADDALAMGYLRFKEFDKAVEMYASICQDYDVAQWSGSIIRLHNQILTQCTDMRIAKVFFDTATSPESFVQLHPSAAARYVQHFYSDTGDAQGVVDIYCRAMKRLDTQPNAQHDIANRINVTAEVLKCVVNQHFAFKGADEEARILIAKIIAASPSVAIVLNTVLSFVSKAWPTSQYIVDLQEEYFADSSKLDFDSLRVLLNSVQSLTTAQCGVDKVKEWWSRLLALKNPQIFDWLSLAKACDNSDRVGYFAEQVAALRPDFSKCSFEKMPLIDKELNSMGVTQKPQAQEDLADAFSVDTVQSEIDARARGIPKVGAQ